MTPQTKAIVREYLESAAIGTALGIPVYLVVRKTWADNALAVAGVMTAFGFGLKYFLLRGHS
jgi:hypothetical protein